MPNDTRRPPEVKPVPQGPDGKRTAFIVIATAVAVGLLVLGGFVLFGGKKPAPVDEPKIYEPAEETQVQTMPVLPGVATTTAEPTASVVPTSPASAQRVDRVAYRLGETLYVANSDGSQRSSVARVPAGEFALSPDGLTLAVVHDSKLTLYDTTTGSPVEVGKATGGRPVWYPDSHAVLFERAVGSGSAVADTWSVARDGTGLREVKRGKAAAISPDGRTVVLIASEGSSPKSSGALFVSRDGGAFKKLPVVSGAPVSVAVADDLMYYSVTAASGEASILSSRLDGTGRRVLRGKPDAQMQTTWGELMLSPNGKVLAAAAIGDDEYSRVSLLSLPNGGETKLSRRRDTRLRGWSASGDCVFVIEGNAYQGEATNLICAQQDGSEQKTLVVGAR